MSRAFRALWEVNVMVPSPVSLRKKQITDLTAGPHPGAYLRPQSLQLGGKKHKPKGTVALPDFPSCPFSTAIEKVFGSLLKRGKEANLGIPPPKKQQDKIR